MLNICLLKNKYLKINLSLSKKNVILRPWDKRQTYFPEAYGIKRLWNFWDNQQTPALFSN